jgi:hypothetical protein
VTELLPIGTIVNVMHPGATYSDVAKVVGYDIGGTKYELGLRYAGWGEWKWQDGGTWAFPLHVSVYSEEQP